MRIQSTHPSLLIASFLAASLLTTFAKGKPGGGGGNNPPPPPPFENQVIAYGWGSTGGRIMDADGGNVISFLPTANSGQPQPSWSPDGTRLVFHVAFDGVDGIYVHDFLASENPVSLLLATGGPNSQADPAWAPVAAPDGRGKIAFNHFVDHPGGVTSREIFLVNDDGSGLIQLTDTPDESEWGIAWSPDASMLLASVNGAGVARLLIYELGHDALNDVVEVVNTYELDTDPWLGSTLTDLQTYAGSWSRAGDRVAFRASFSDAPSTVHVMDLLTGTVTALTDQVPGTYTEMCWSPDDAEMIVRGLDVPNTATKNPSDTIAWGIYKISTVTKPTSADDLQLLSTDTFPQGLDWWRGNP